MAARPKSVRHAADPADRDNKSDQTGKQQPGTALDRRQDADSENGAHSDPNRESTKQFHGGYVTRLGRRFKPSLSRSARLHLREPHWDRARTGWVARRRAPSFLIAF